MNRSSLALVLTVIAAVALPVSVHYGVSAYKEYRALKYRYAAAQRQRVALEAYGQQVVQYQQFLEHVRRFLRTAESAGIDDARWTRHQVSVTDEPVPFAELGQFVAEANSGQNYHFLPRKLRMRTPAARSFNSPHLRQVAQQARDGVVVSLEGAFLVPVR